MFFSFLLLLFTVLAFFAVKAKTFDQLGTWSQITIIGFASLISATILTMQFFISIRKTILAFLEAIEGIPLLVVGGVFLILFVLIFPVLRLLGRMDLEHLKQYWQEEIRPRQKMLTRSALELFRSFTWERTKSLFNKVRPGGNRRKREDPFPGEE